MNLGICHAVYCSLSDLFQDFGSFFIFHVYIDFIEITLKNELINEIMNTSFMG